MTAGNASQQNDAAAACLVVAEDKLEELGLEPMLVVPFLERGGLRPEPHGHRAGARGRTAVRAELAWAWDDIGLVELNEAFAPQVLAVLKGWGWSADDSAAGTSLTSTARASASAIRSARPGIRILADMAHEMHRRQVRYGLETMCIGGGQGMAAVLERAA